MTPLLVVLAVFGLGKLADSQIALCTIEYCESLEADCPPIPLECTIQNATHNGLELPYMGPCNCCDYCLRNIAEGEDCAVGTPTSLVPTSICGYGLMCIEDKEEKTKTCQRIITPCTGAQAEYDKAKQEGTLPFLQLRPNCDRNGLYEPYECVPGEICYCVDEDGNRIFGEIPYTSQPQLYLNCHCARNVNKAAKFHGREILRSEHLRCRADGSYDPIQCLGDQCLCVDTEDSKPTYPKMALVNRTLVSEESLPCFDETVHAEYEYYRDCEAKFMAIYNTVREDMDKGYEVYGQLYPNCQLDGYYTAVQETLDSKYCSDLEGKQMGNFSVPLDSPEAADMNCKCARSRSMITDVEKPECLQNGNYNPMQCRRGKCYCVDSNGKQVVKEVPSASRNTLPCYTDA